MAALDQAHIAGRVRPGHIVDDIRNPGPGAIDQTFGAEGPGFARQRCGLNRPAAILAACRGGWRAGQHHRALFRRPNRIQRDQSGVIDPAVGIFEPAFASSRIGAPLGRGAGFKCRCPAVFLRPPDDRKETGPDAPARQGGLAGCEPAQKRISQMMCGAAFSSTSRSIQLLSDQAKLVIFQIAQPAMHQLARTRRGALCQIVLFTQDNRQAAPLASRARNARTVDAAADHEKDRSFRVHWSSCSPDA